MQEGSSAGIHLFTHNVPSRFTSHVASRIEYILPMTVLYGKFDTLVRRQSLTLSLVGFNCDLLIVEFVKIGFFLTTMYAINIQRQSLYTARSLLVLALMRKLVFNTHAATWISDEDKNVRLKWIRDKVRTYYALIQQCSFCITFTSMWTYSQLTSWPSSLIAATASREIIAWQLP